VAGPHKNMQFVTGPHKNRQFRAVIIHNNAKMTVMAAPMGHIFDSSLNSSLNIFDPYIHILAGTSFYLLVIPVPAHPPVEPL
jgi:hypothetical protein